MNVERSALLPFSSQQIYAVINDVRAYPEFLNWCSAAHVKSESDHKKIAELKIAYGRLNFAFSTVNTMQPNESIDMNLMSGPFKKLSGQWQINALGESSCKVSLNMAFSFKNPLTHRVFAKVFQGVVSAQVEAFEKRANELYGGANAQY